MCPCASSAPATATATAPRATAGRCTVLGNALRQGAGGGCPPTATGVHCDDGACARIENNALITARGARTGYGVFLLNTNAFVNGNRIDAGCDSVLGVGLEAENSFARVQNNAILGTVCPNGSAATSYGVRVVVAAGSNELDLHSNDLFGAGGGACT